MWESWTLRDQTASGLCFNPHGGFCYLSHTTSDRQIGAGPYSALSSPLTGGLLFPAFILSTGIHFVNTPRHAADILATFIQSDNLLPSLPHYPSSPWNFLKEIVTIFLGFWFSDNSPICALIPHFRKAIFLTGSYPKPPINLWYNVGLHKYLLQCLCHTHFVCVNCYA